MIRNISISEWLKKHKTEIFLTKEAKQQIGLQNFKTIFIMLHLTLVLGLCNYIPLLIKYWNNLGAKHTSLIYFGSFTLLSLIDLLLCFFIKFIIKSDDYRVRNIPFYFAIVSVFICITYRTFTFGSALSGVLLIAIVSLVVLIFCNIHPTIFIILLALPILGEVHVLFFDYTSDNIADLVLFYIVLILLAHFKRKTAVNAIRATTEMEKQKKALEDAYSQQSEEIETQAIELLHQNRKLIKFQNETIISLSNLVENRDSDTGAHVKRTSQYVNILASAALNSKIYPDIIDENFVELATKAAPLHDIGKIVVSDAILKKPGKLTDEEFEEIKRHAKEGGKIVQDVLGVSADKDYVEFATEIATYHHEKWNGMGYPTGKKEYEIPVCARIMAIADVYDALVSKRCYKESMSYEEAVEIIKSSSGSHFDPQLVELFLQNTDEFKSIALKYKD